MHRLTVTEIAAQTDRVSLFTFEADAAAALPPYEPGAHIDIDLGAAGLRSYSLIDFQPQIGAPSCYHVAVQREDEGGGGSRAMHALSVGDCLQVSDPKNDFSLHEGGAPALLIAGGIGVTPIISFATALQHRGTPFAFHYATRSKALCTFGELLQERFSDQITLCYDDEAPLDLEKVIAEAPSDAQIYCCGPKGMIDAVRATAEAVGIPSDRIHFELFSAPDLGADADSFEVELTSTGQVFTIPADKTIVEVLEEEGVDVMFDCARGDCGICQTDVVSGIPDHRDVVLSEAERASGKVMQICVSRAKSARLVLDI